MSEKKLNFTEVVSNIQTELKANKGQENKFGKYKYRSCEDILESVKPLLKEHKAILTLTDSIELIGERYYLKAVATLQIEDVSISTSAYAREPLSQKGMAEPQVTGSASSYARKYALNGLFAIDDTKDDDTKDNRDNKKPEQKPKTTTGQKNTEKKINNFDDLYKYVHTDIAKQFKVKFKTDSPENSRKLAMDTFKACGSDLAKFSDLVNKTKKFDLED